MFSGSISLMCRHIRGINKSKTGNVGQSKQKKKTKSKRSPMQQKNQVIQITENESMEYDKESDDEF